jgi:hypothetical protein
VDNVVYPSYIQLKKGVTKSPLSHHIIPLSSKNRTSFAASLEVLANEMRVCEQHLAAPLSLNNSIVTELCDGRSRTAVQILWHFKLSATTGSNRLLLDGKWKTAIREESLAGARKCGFPTSGSWKRLSSHAS